MLLFVYQYYLCWLGKIVDVKYLSFVIFLRVRRDAIFYKNEKGNGKYKYIVFSVKQ